jgi:DNA-binding beta-propeller fold protein YncE
MLALLASLLLAAPVAAQSPPEGIASPGVDKAKGACPSPGADQTIKLPGRPFAAEPSRDNCYLFVSLIGGRGTGSVAVVANEGGSFRLIRTVAMTGGSGGGLSLTHDGSLLAVAAEESVILLDVAKLEDTAQEPVVATLPDAGHGAIYTQFSRDDAWLFVSEEHNSSIAVIDVATARQSQDQGKRGKAIIGRIPVGQAPVGLALAPDGATLYSTSQVLGTSGQCAPERAGGPAHAEGGLIVIDVARAVQDPSHAVANAIRAGCNPVRVVVSADGRSLWVSQRGSDSVMGLDTSALAPGASPGKSVSIAVGRSPVGLAIRPDGTQLWVANSDRFASAAGSLTLVTPANPREARPAGSFNVGAFPRDLRFMPDGRTLVIALFGEQAVMVHPTASTDASHP